MTGELKYNLRNLLALRFLSAIVSDNLFLIFGCQRSGTTLLLSVLNAHPQITGIDETEFPSPYPFPSAQRLIYSKISNNYLCFKILEHSNKLDFLKRFYPKAKILWSIRNPHSTVASMLNLVNSEGDWIERCAMREIARLKPFYSQELAQYNWDKISKIELGSIYWLYKNKYPTILKNQGFDILIFKYEDLIQEQQKTLEKITDFLGLEWSNDLLNFYQKNPSKSLAGGTRTDRPIDCTKAINLKGLTKDDIKLINQVCQPLIDNYNYSYL